MLKLSNLSPITHLILTQMKNSLCPCPYYHWTAEVDFTKDGKTNTSTIYGLICLNQNGKISYVWFIDGDNGIMKILHEAN